MRVTYYAVKSMMVGDQSRQPGDLVPEVADWPYLTHYVQEGKVAPVLVVTLPQEVQDMLSEWEHREDEEPAVDSEQESGVASPEDDPTKEAAPEDTPVTTDVKDIPVEDAKSAPRSTRKDK